MAKMRADGWRVVINEHYHYLCKPTDLAFTVKFWKEVTPERYGLSSLQFPYAVTTAALRACGVTDEEMGL